MKGPTWIDLDSFGIEELVALRDRVTEKLAEKVAARQTEFEAEMEKLSQYGKSAKNSQGPPAVAKTRRSVEGRGKDGDEVKENRGGGPIAEAA